MKNLLKIAFLLLTAVAAGAATVASPPAPLTGFGVGTTNAATTLSYAVVSANSANGGAPAVSFISAGSDKATSVIQFYKVDAIVRATFTNSTTRIDVVETNGLADNGTIVIRHVFDDTYEKRTLTTSTGATNLVVTAAPLGTVRPGDIIYHVTTTGAGSIKWGATTNTLGNGGGPIFVGQSGMPLLLEVDATGSAGSLQCAGGTYIR